MSDDSFLERAYRELLEREIDAEGREVFGGALARGVDRFDVVLAMVRSEEFLERTVRRLNSLPNLIELHPERYRAGRHANARDASITVFDVSGPEAFDWIERQVLDHGFYELPGIWSLEETPASRLTADLVARLASSPVLELGCSAGILLEALADRGIAGEGVEISRMAIAKASPRVRPRIRHGDLLDLSLESRFSLIVGLDVFEHLNPNRLGGYVERIYDLLVPEGLVFANIPAIGPDAEFGTVCPSYLDDWLEDERAHRLFSSLHVDERGFPLQGHLAWADTTWWTRLFTGAGFARETEIEHVLHADFDSLLDEHCPARRAFYVFSKEMAAGTRGKRLAALRGAGRPARPERA